MYSKLNKWDVRFLELAKYVAQWSKDPSTKTGAVIVDKDKSVVSVGFNGFARGVLDGVDRYNNRDLKYKLIVHSECNAILYAKGNTTDTTLYTWPFMPCSRCAGLVIQSGITHCVAPPLPNELIDRWKSDTDIAAMQFAEAGVELNLIPLP